MTPPIPPDIPAEVTTTVTNTTTVEQKVRSGVMDLIGLVLGALMVLGGGAMLGVPLYRNSPHDHFNEGIAIGLVLLGSLCLIPSRMDFALKVLKRTAPENLP